ncbi:transmembrane protein 79 [Aplochiton taeniatus]
MSEFLPSNVDLLKGDPSERCEITDPQISKWVTDGESKIIAQNRLDGEEAEEMVSSAKLEPTTLQWPGDRDRRTPLEDGSREDKVRREDTEGEGRSVHSECFSLQGGESRTESERELGLGDKKRPGEGWMDLERDPEDLGPKKSQVEKEVDDGEEGQDAMNSLPEKAAQVFTPAITILKSSSAPASPWNSEAMLDVKAEMSPFLGHHRTPPDGYYHDLPAERHSKCGCDCYNRDALKVGVSVFTAMLIFPLLVWGGYVFLPFDAPLLDNAPLRLVYTLRCSVFAMVPIILGWLVLGISRLRAGAVKPLCDGEVESREVRVHQSYVNDSVSLFLLYFLQLAVMAPYLNQELLKLVPLLTIIFAFGRLVYWVAAALGSSVRGFGFGLSFLPTVAMLGANLYFIITMEAGGTIFAQEVPADENPPSSRRQRFWG